MIFWRRPELNWPVGDERVVPGVSVGGGQRQQQLPLLGVFQQDAGDVAAGAELGCVVIDVGEVHSDGDDALVHKRIKNWISLLQFKLSNVSTFILLFFGCLMTVNFVIAK